MEPVMSLMVYTGCTIVCSFLTFVFISFVAGNFEHYIKNTPNTSEGLVPWLALLFMSITLGTCSLVAIILMIRTALSLSLV